MQRLGRANLRREYNIGRYLQEMGQSVKIQFKWLRAEYKCRALAKPITEWRVSLQIRDFLVVCSILTSNIDI